MKRTTTLTLAAVVSGLALTTGGVFADGPQFRETVIVRGTINGSAADHHLTFSGPIALPGVSLGAGTYIFRRPANNVLQVLNASTREPYAMMTTVAAARTSRANTYEIAFAPPAMPGAPRRLDAWFVPGESSGQQLIYRSR